MSDIYESGSPRWSWTTKLLVGLTIVAILVGLLIRFRNYVGPLLLVFILTYLTYPAAQWLRSRLHVSWRVAVTIIYFLLVLILIGLLTLGGLALVEQAQSLYNLIDNAVSEQLPQLLDTLSNQVYRIGPFQFDLTRIDVDTVTNQILSAVQPLLGQVGTLVTTIATSAASFLGWVAFVLLISYFITAESKGGSGGSLALQIPGHSYDIRRLSLELRHIWNAFLTGQLILFFLTVLIYTILLSILEVRYSLGLALLAGFGRFLPYIGPAIAWTAYALVTLFQGYTPFGIPPLVYTGVVLGISVVVDMIFDNFVSPKIMGQALKVHPAAVLIAALVAANLIGIIGVLLAAPVLATLQLLLRYTLRKLFDLDPWEGIEYTSSAANARIFLPPGLQERFDVIRARARQTFQRGWAALARRFRKPQDI